jgi:hypothetical protein
MGLLEFFEVGEQAGEAISKPVDAIGNLLDKLFTSDEERAVAEQVMEKIKQHPQELQAEINKLEAQHRSWFVAGWRPAIGWVCGISLFMYFVPQFIIASILWTKACWVAEKLVAYPADASGLFELILAMLGMATIRTVEKINRVTK